MRPDEDEKAHDDASKSSDGEVDGLSDPNSEDNTSRGKEDDSDEPAVNETTAASKPAKDDSTDSKPDLRELIETKSKSKED